MLTAFPLLPSLSIHPCRGECTQMEFGWEGSDIDTHHPHTNQNPQSNEEKEDQGVCPAWWSVRVSRTSARDSCVIGQSLFKSRERESGVEIWKNEEEGREMVVTRRGKGVVRFESVTCSEPIKPKVWNVHAQQIVPLDRFGNNIISEGYVFIVLQLFLNHIFDPFHS
ncbi:hypothetical protein BLNAU_20946 [Blattamonas nauphoetae]|uniref:Uncharacterized protein n=1 Tax=Blattamonas nauphoetae TaxID=2049346 RepID=A0ABQ9WX94_9EUKA|nr:hypothetical protein BLNAU_20946 [Blattamonas nauphoetae]